MADHPIRDYETKLPEEWTDVDGLECAADQLVELAEAQHREYCSTGEAAEMCVFEPNARGCSVAFRCARFLLDLGSKWPR